MTNKILDPWFRPILGLPGTHCHPKPENLNVKLEENNLKVRHKKLENLHV